MGCDREKGPGSHNQFDHEPLAKKRRFGSIHTIEFPDQCYIVFCLSHDQFAAVGRKDVAADHVSRLVSDHTRQAFKVG